MRCVPVPIRRFEANSGPTDQSAPRQCSRLLAGNRRYPDGQRTIVSVAEIVWRGRSTALPSEPSGVPGFKSIRRPMVIDEWRQIRDLLLPGASPELRRHLELTEKLLTLRLDDADWVQYKDQRVLTPHGSPTFSKAVAAGERFYAAAEARNGVMARNLLAHLVTDSVLLTGRVSHGLPKPRL